MSQSEVVTVRLTSDLKAKLDSLSASTQRSKSWLAAEAIAQYVEQEAWQIQGIEAAVALADSSRRSMDRERCCRSVAGFVGN